jgi:hypothetical protein
MYMLCPIRCARWLDWRPSEKCLAELEELRQAQIAGAISMLKNTLIVD